MLGQEEGERQELEAGACLGVAVCFLRSGPTICHQLLPLVLSISGSCHWGHRQVLGKGRGHLIPPRQVPSCRGQDTSPISAASPFQVSSPSPFPVTQHTYNKYCISAFLLVGHE